MADPGLKPRLVQVRSLCLTMTSYCLHPTPFPEASRNTKFKGTLLWSACAGHLHRSLWGQGFPDRYPVSPERESPAPTLKPCAPALSTVMDSPGRADDVDSPSLRASGMGGWGGRKKMIPSANLSLTWARKTNNLQPWKRKGRQRQNCPWQRVRE